MDEEFSLLPTVDIPDFTEESDEYDTEYRPSLKWDIESGDFVRDGTNRIMTSDGYDAFKIWCLKAVQTERYTCAAYSDDIGVEMEDACKELDQRAVELSIERTIRETLEVNPRTAAVEDFEFSWNGDEVYATFTVIAVNNDGFTMEITVTAE